MKDFKKITDLNSESYIAVTAQINQLVRPLVDFCLTNGIGVDSLIDKILFSIDSGLNYFGNDVFTSDRFDETLKEKIGEGRYNDLLAQASMSSAIWSNFNRYHISTEFERNVETFIKKPR